MAADPIEDAWMEECLVAISIVGGSDVQFAAVTETLDFDVGEKDIEGIPLTNGGRVTKWNPESDTTVTVEAYPLEAGTDSGTVGLGFYDLLHTSDASVPVRVINTRNRYKVRMLVLWTNDSTATTAQSITVADASAIRFGMVEARVTSTKASFTDGVLKWTIMVKCAPFDKAGLGNVMWESCAGSSGSDLLPAIASYTSSNKFG